MKLSSILQNLRRTLVKFWGLLTNTGSSRRRSTSVKATQTKIASSGRKIRSRVRKPALVSACSLK